MRLPAVILFAALVTASAQTPNDDDLIWQKSVQKFDAKRAAITTILRGKIEGNHHAPFCRIFPP